MQSGSDVTIIDYESGLGVWGDDAPAVLARLSHSDAVRHGETVFVSKSSDVERVLRSSRDYASGPDAGFLGSEEGLIPLQVDPPEHVRYRRILDPLFAPRRMAKLAQGIEELAEECMDAFVSRGHCNFSEEFAVPFPAGTFLDLMGLPRSGLPEFLVMKDAIIRPQGSTPEEMALIRAQAGQDIHAMFESVLEGQGAADGSDVASALRAREREGALTRAESLNICHLLLLAGLDTVTGALQTTFALLARRADLRAALAGGPVADSAVEELLRWSVTSPMQNRVVRCHDELTGVEVRPGDRVSVVNGTLNFDPEQVVDPLQVDLGRERNRHASFGIGVHRCLGSHLARLEMRLALQVWHRRLPDYRVAEGCPIVYSPGLREVRDLALAWD